MSEFASSASHEEVRYSQVWEDHSVLAGALAVGPGDDVLSIASAGCNVLALLLDEPRSIVAVDISPAQAALTELKLVAIRELATDALARFVGARPAKRDRLEVYRSLTPMLSAEGRGYWDENLHVLRAGVIGSGMLDRYVRAFQERYLRPLVDPAAVRRLLGLADPEAQLALFDREFVSLELAVRDWFGRDGLLGARDASQFRYVRAVDVGGSFWKRFREVATELPARGNFYLEWLLTGEYADLSLGPPYLVAENHERLRGLVDRVTLVRGELSNYLRETPGRSFSAANMSDVFEYLSESQSEQLLSLLATRLRHGGRIAYWNLFVERSRTDGVGGQLESVPGAGDRLFVADRVPFYTAFRVEQVVER